MTIERKVFAAEIKAHDKENLIVEHFISTETPDRGGDIVRAAGMRIKGKPVVLLGHGRGAMGSEPIAKPLSITRDTYKGKPGIFARTQFFNDETGQRLFEKTVGGFMPNWSIGFIPIKSMDIDGGMGRDIKEWDLLEYSLVGVPMNPEAQTMKDMETVGEIDFKIMPDGEPVDGDEKPYPNEHACRVNDPAKYDRMRRENNKFGAGIHVIWGVKGDSAEVQAIRFSSDKFTADAAKAWAKEHKYTCKPFEAATGKEADGGSVCDIPPDAETDDACVTCGKKLWKHFTIVNDVVAPEKVYCKTGCEIVCKTPDPAHTFAVEGEGKATTPEARMAAIETMLKDMTAQFKQMDDAMKAITETMKSFTPAPPAPPAPGKSADGTEPPNPPEPESVPRLVIVRDDVKPESEVQKELVVNTVRNVVSAHVNGVIARMRGKVS